MDLQMAQRAAEHLATWLKPYCDRVEIAGSIRRRRPVVNDVDLVCIPKIHEERDMLGGVISSHNYAFEFLVDYVKQRNPVGSKSESLPHMISGGEKPGKQMLLWLPKQKIQLDLWFAEKENFASRLLMRTGSKEHNIWLCERAQDRGLKWDPYEGIIGEPPPREGVIGEQARPHPGPLAQEREMREVDLYARLGLAFIEPVNREIEWLRKHVDSGLVV